MSANKIFILFFSFLPVVNAGPADTERAAFNGQKISVNRIEQVLSRSRGTENEPILLARLIESRWLLASVALKISQLEAVASKRPMDLKPYFRELVELERSSEELISRYPTDGSIPRAYYLRARARKEMGKNAEAISDFRTLIANYPSSADAAFSALSLSELLFKSKNYKETIQYLLRLRAQPSESFYAQATERLAWSYYEIGDFNKAIKTQEELVRSMGNIKNRDANQQMEMEKGIQTLAKFYLQGIDRGMTGYSLESAFQVLSQLSAGVGFGKIAAQFAYLLRSRNQEQQLNEWLELAMGSRLPSGYKMEILAIVLEDYLNKRKYQNYREGLKRFGQLQATPEDPAFKGRKDLENYRSAQNIRFREFLNESVIELQKSLVKNQETTYIPEINQTLLLVYQVILVQENQDPAKIALLNYNLAESAFQAKEFTSATQRYRMLYDLLRSGKYKPDKPVEIKNFGSAEIKAISSRYEELRKRGLFQARIEAQPLAESKEFGPDQGLSEWLDWLKEYPVLSYSKTPEYEEKISAFRFEANRLIYAQGYYQEALKRIMEELIEAPASAYAIPAASLVIDTYVAGKEWNKVIEAAVKFDKLGVGRGMPFAGKLRDLIEDATIKIAETSFSEKLYGDVISQIDSYLEKFPRGKRQVDALNLAGNAAVARGDRALAVKYFGKIPKNAQTSTNLLNASLTAVNLSEEKFDFKAAATELRDYLEASERQNPSRGDKDREELKRKALLYAAISGNRNVFASVVQSKSICISSLLNECNRYSGLYHLMYQKEDPALQQKIRLVMRSADATAKLLWAAVALEVDNSASSFTLAERLQFLKTIQTEFSKIDPIFRFTLVPYLSQSIPATFRHARETVKAEYPLKLSKSAIAERVKRVQILEKALPGILEFPFVRPQVGVLYEYSHLYFDLIKELDALNAPEELKKSFADLKASFYEKGKDAQQQAFQLAVKNTVEENIFQTVQGSYEAIFPEKYAQVAHDWVSVRAFEPTIEALPLDLKDVDDSSNAEDTKKKSLFVEALRRALLEKNAPLLAYLIQIGELQLEVPAIFLQSARGLALLVSGARSEGVIELTDILGSGKISQRQELQLATSLLSLSHNALNSEASRRLLGSVNRLLEDGNAKKNLNVRDAQLILQTHQWVRSGLSEEVQRELANWVQPPERNVAELKKENENASNGAEEAEENKKVKKNF